KDMAQAEDSLADAFEAALRDWPATGCPANPEAWLLTVARRKAIDASRRRKSGEVAGASLLLLSEGLEAVDAERGLPGQRLALMFACTNPAVEAGIRAPLMLQVVLGLDARTIASAFLASPAAMSKRLVRAKERIRQAAAHFSMPERGELSGLDAVLEAIYA